MIVNLKCCLNFNTCTFKATFRKFPGRVLNKIFKFPHWAEDDMTNIAYHNGYYYAAHYHYNKPAKKEY